jgi:hypothetical protein
MNKLILALSAAAALSMSSAALAGGDREPLRLGATARGSKIRGGSS